jgi:contact-dependent growth inhibition (CDI) system CdiI-like immunity protein
MSREQGIATARDLRDLRRLFSAYLHEDFDDEFGTPEAAVLAFKEQSREQGLSKATDELRELLDRGLSEDELKDVLKWGLGSGYIPPDGAISVWLQEILRTLES